MKVWFDSRFRGDAFNLDDVPLAVIGLWHMGVDDPVLIADLLSIDGRRFVELLRLMNFLLDTDNATIRDLVENGFPAGLSAPLPGREARVMCPLCRAFVGSVPCPYCNLRTPYRKPRRYHSEPDPPMPRCAVTARPGHFLKIRAMRARYLRGEAVFHPNDATLTDTVSVTVEGFVVGNLEGEDFQ